jgi:hypothetical protein
VIAVLEHMEAEQAGGHTLQLLAYAREAADFVVARMQYLDRTRQFGQQLTHMAGQSLAFAHDL